MLNWQEIAWWIGINIVLGVFGPLIIGYLFVDLTVAPPKLALRTFYGKGELAFGSLLIALSVIVDVRKSNFGLRTVQLIIGALAVFGFIAAQTWAVPLCVDLVATGKVEWDKVWKRSWIVALLIFSVGIVTEILLAIKPEK